MRTPNFLFEEFVDNTIFNTAMSELIASIRETGANDTFLIPGVINPASLLFTFNSNLTVTLTTPNIGVSAFKCLFQTGAITAGHGTVDGVDSSSYTVDFTSLVPGVGSVTAYIVAQYATVQESSTTIIGAPPGHPDYSNNFVPYIGYTVLQDTLSIFTTTTAPDNQLTIELGRTTLVAGQTQVTSVNTSNQVLARVNANTTLVGDVTGPVGSNRISNLQGNPVNAASPSVNNALVWNGTAWAPVALPTTLPPSGPAGGDLGGNYPNPTVVKSSVPTFDANNISAIGNIVATGFLSGANASLGNQAIMLQQLGTIASIAPLDPTFPGDIYHQSFKLPVLQGGVLAYIIVNFGFWCSYGLDNGDMGNKLLNPGGFYGGIPSYSILYDTPFTQGALFSTYMFVTTDPTGLGAFAGGTYIIETPELLASGAPLDRTLLYCDDVNLGSQVIKFAGPGKNGLLGFSWIIAGI